MIVQLVTPDVTRLRARIRALEALQRKVAGELRTTRRDLAAARKRGTYRPRTTQPSCGTEAAYQWHRYHERDTWPLPAADPCGCREAHRIHERVREGRDIAC